MPGPRATQDSRLATDQDAPGEAASTTEREGEHGPATESFVDRLRVASFWTAIVLPIAYLPILAIGSDGTRTGLFVTLLAVHLVALYVGHAHNVER
ncbi:hypothetical protein [Natronosalvus halobius]|uniref:hypothetical protein n=1 Tax=Natronosalvus halobius TaxID=2953746 RepID=UPI00209D04F5|nr:hypothetical protein [Natronosalvus halobius]USZ72622.1 hypothetical protein NGM15_04710 [Natronosalvus halobius]